MRTPAKNDGKKVICARRESFAGQIIIESVVATSVLVVGFLGLFALLARSFYLSRIVQDNYAATYLAAEGIEVVKNIVDHNVVSGLPWNSGFANGDYEVEYGSASLAASANRTLSFDSSANVYRYAGNVRTSFRRLMRINLASQNELRVNSIVSWNTGLFQSSVNLEDRFFNWY